MLAILSDRAQIIEKKESEHAQAVIRVQYTDMQVQYRKAISCMEEEQYDKAIILFEGLPGDYEDARNNFRE